MTPPHAVWHGVRTPGRQPAMPSRSCEAQGYSRCHVARGHPVGDARHVSILDTSPNTLERAQGVTDAVASWTRSNALGAETPVFACRNLQTSGSYPPHSGVSAPSVFALTDSHNCAVRSRFAAG